MRYIDEDLQNRRRNASRRGKTSDNKDKDREQQTASPSKATGKKPSNLPTTPFTLTEMQSIENNANNPLASKLKTFDDNMSSRSKVSNTKFSLF
jgi:hypothetical protein